MVSFIKLQRLWLLPSQSTESLDLCERKPHLATARRYFISQFVIYCQLCHSEAGRDYIINTLRILWKRSIFNTGKRKLNKISYQHVRTEARSLATLAYPLKIDQFVSRLLTIGLEFCMWHLWWMVCDWSQFESNTGKFFIPLKLEANSISLKIVIPNLQNLQMTALQNIVQLHSVCRIGLQRCCRELSSLMSPGVPSTILCEIQRPFHKLHHWATYQKRQHALLAFPLSSLHVLGALDSYDQPT